MSKVKYILRFSCIYLTLLCSHPVKAQLTRIDSILQILEHSNQEGKVDTAEFNTAITVINNTVLNDSSIALLEKTGDKLSEYWKYRIKISILNSLTITDKYKAIDYGRFNYEALEGSKIPHAINIKSSFLKSLRLPYRNSNKLSEGFEYFNKKLKEYKIKNDSCGLADCYYVLAGFYRTIGLMDQAIYNMKKSVSYMDTVAKHDKGFGGSFPKPNGWSLWARNTGVIGQYYLTTGNYKEAILYNRVPLEGLLRGKITNAGITIIQAQANLMLGEMDSVNYYLDLPLDIVGNIQYEYMALSSQVRALYKLKTGELSEAEELLKQCWRLIEEHGVPVYGPAGLVAPDYYLALIRIQQNRIDDAIPLLIKDIKRLDNQRLDKLRDYKLLGALYEKRGNAEKSKDAFKSFISLQDSLLADQGKYSSLSFETEQQMSENELSITKLQNASKISSLVRNFSIGIAFMLFVLAIGLYNRFLFKKKAHAVLEKTLSELKSTQTQLIHSEKMASLGELTAGIAHEIQNPLNFVNNFSEVNKELLLELKEEIEKGHFNQVKIIANSVIDNQEKINHHGKRADAIVKGMLQHSRSSSGIKEQSDINALCDEYLRLSYHGLRAKDKSFNATLKTDFDPTLGSISIVPQDIGRVILNLLTNAFYAVTESKNKKGADFVPTVSIRTKKIANKVEICVKDNGNGIPKNVLDKIFQPFFTTKPTGQGTGLGLSLSYDIVTKGHGGELKVETKVGEGSQFILTLPVS